jgi:hypothetical protein
MHRQRPARSASLPVLQTRAALVHFENGGDLNANVTIIYTGLEIKGGSGRDFIENDAKNGIVTVGNGNLV